MFPFDTSRSPLWNSAGTLGFSPPRRHPLTTALGAFVTNPVSWGARTPAQGSRLLPYAGGVLLHTGLPNLGFLQVMRQFGRQWARAELPIIVHLLVENPEHLHRMVRKLEETDGVAGLELGLPPDVDATFQTEIIQAARGELPLILRLPPDGVLPPLLPDAISLSPLRGTLPDGTATGLVQGRLFGPGMLPQALHTVRVWKTLGIPILAGGGVYHPAHAEAFLKAGADVVQLDVCLWRDVWPDEMWARWLATFPSKSSLAHH